MSTALHWTVALAGPTGLLLWGLIEYAMHRFVFHDLEPFHGLHAEHHRKPLALIVTPTLGSGVALGVTIGYFACGVVHYSVHHWHANSHWMRQCKRQHAIHHHNSRVNDGVTMPR